MQIRAALCCFYTSRLLYSGTAQLQYESVIVVLVLILVRFGVVTTAWLVGGDCICMLHNSLSHFITSVKLVIMLEVSMR